MKQIIHTIMYYPYWFIQAVRVALPEIHECAMMGVRHEQEQEVG